MKGKKPKSEMERTQTPVGKPPRHSVQLKAPQEVAVNLDQKGESHWVYPDAAGKYAFPMERCDATEVTTPYSGITAESADSKELEDLLKGFSSNPRGKDGSIAPLMSSPKEGARNVNSWTQYNQKPGYSSNIANIIKSSNAMGSSPSLGKSGELVVQTTTLGLTSKLNHGSFPKDIFQVSLKPKRAVP